MKNPLAPLPGTHASHALSLIRLFPLLAIAACATTPGSDAGTTSKVRITLVGINDLHGNIESKELVLGEGKNSRKVKVGGVEILGAYLDAIRKSNPEGTLVLDAGDAYQGTLLSNSFHGKPVIEAYNALGIDASTLGNHEFDFGEGPDAAGKRDPQGVLRGILAAAHYPYLSANVFRKGTTESPFPGVKRSRIFERAGVKVGVIGVTTTATPESSNPKHVAGIEFRKLGDVVPAEAQELRKQGAQVVVLLAHTGGTCDMKRPPREGDAACAAEQSNELNDFLRTLPAGTVDAVIAGHIHAAQAHFIKGVPVAQTTGFGNSLSRIDLVVDPQAPAGSRVSAEIAKPLFLCHKHFANYSSCNPDEAKFGGRYPESFGAEITPSYAGTPILPKAALAGTIAPYQAKVKELIERKIVSLPVALTHDRTRESAVANCVTDALRDEVALAHKLKSDVALFNSGSIRAPLPQGTVNFGAIYAVLPFDGGLALATLTGAELERFGQELGTNPKNIAVISSGWKVRLKKEAQFPRHVAFVPPKGAKVDPKATYRVLTSSFNVLPGGAFDSVFAKANAEGRIEQPTGELRDLFASRMQRLEGIPPSCQGKGDVRTVFE